ncbi:MAG: iron-containing alcohol dehydrogenase [Clostridia bacterium]|nr:iron-containing alcohol dehydrogenase [Clostridia bacterium]
MDFGFYLPTRFISGPDCVKENAAAINALGSKPLIVTGKSSAKLCGALGDVLGAVGDHVIFDGIRQNPDISSCRLGAQIARENGCDCVIGIGGGSPLDASKAIALIAAFPDITEEKLFSGKLSEPGLKVVCVGTTAGTGSEVTPVAVITGSDGRKRSVKGSAVFPALSLGDPKYTYALDRRFTVSTAVDALCHCAESFFNRASNAFSRRLAVCGIKEILEPLKKLAAGKTPDAADRKALYEGSIYGGMAISVTGTAMCHALGYFLTENHRVPHGFACGVYLERFLLLSSLADPGLADGFFSEIGTGRIELSDLVKALCKGESPSVSSNEIASLEGRWVSNGSLDKCLFETSPDGITELISSLFGD